MWPGHHKVVIRKSLDSPMLIPESYESLIASIRTKNPWTPLWSPSQVGANMAMLSFRMLCTELSPVHFLSPPLRQCLAPSREGGNASTPSEKMNCQNKSYWSTRACSVSLSKSSVGQSSGRLLLSCGCGARSTGLSHAHFLKICNTNIRNISLGSSKWQLNVDTISRKYIHTNTTPDSSYFQEIPTLYIDLSLISSLLHDMKQRVRKNTNA